jgi:transposase InsO family protein
VVRGKKPKTTIGDATKSWPKDRVHREFQAPCPNTLWVSDFTYVATSAGFVYVAFVIDVFARMIVGWRDSHPAHAGFVLDALEQALHDRRPIRGGGLVHHSDRGVQGGFNRSSQHPNFQGVHDDRKAEIRALNATQIILARTASRLAA